MNISNIIENYISTDNNTDFINFIYECGENGIKNDILESYVRRKGKKMLEKYKHCKIRFILEGLAYNRIDGFVPSKQLLYDHISSYLFKGESDQLLFFIWGRVIYSDGKFLIKYKGEEIEVERDDVSIAGHKLKDSFDEFDEIIIDIHNKLCSTEAYYILINNSFGTTRINIIGDKKIYTNMSVTQVNRKLLVYLYAIFACYKLNHDKCICSSIIELITCVRFKPCHKCIIWYEYVCSLVFSTTDMIMINIISNKHHNDAFERDKNIIIRNTLKNIPIDKNIIYREPYINNKKLLYEMVLILSMF